MVAFPIITPDPSVARTEPKLTAHCEAADRIVLERLQCALGAQLARSGIGFSPWSEPIA
jgi:hypothetical protein